jgi:hypothetical protein
MTGNAVVPATFPDRSPQDPTAPAARDSYTRMQRAFRKEGHSRSRTMKRHSVSTVAGLVVLAAAGRMPAVAAEPDFAVLFNSSVRLAATIAGGSSANGTRLSTYFGYGARHQVFQLLNPNPAAEGTWYTLRVTHTDQCLDVEGPSRENGAEVHQWPCFSPIRSNQRWLVINTGRNDPETGRPRYKLVNGFSNKCLDIRGHGNDGFINTTLQQWDCTEADHQLFLLLPHAAI